MNYIHKHCIELLDRPQELPLHAAAAFLHFDVQRDVFTTWWLDNTSEAPDPVIVHVFPTGAPVSPPDGKAYLHLGTILHGAFVWHLFQLHPAPPDKLQLV